MYLHSSPILRSFFIILFLFLKFHRAITNVDRQNGEIFDLTSPPRPVRPSISQLRFSILQSYPAVSRKNFKLFNSQTPPTNLRHRNTWLNIILLLSGDLHPNPGPVKYPCGTPVCLIIIPVCLFILDKSAGEYSYYFDHKFVSN